MDNSDEIIKKRNERRRELYYKNGTNEKRRKKYYLNKQNPEWLKHYNERRKKWSETAIKNNPEKVRKNALKRANTYKNRHPLKVICYGANKRHTDKITAFDLWKIAKKQKMRCAITGDKLTKSNISLDHIIPRCNGGTNVVGNLRFLTLQVNRAKNSLSDKELFDMCQKIINGLSEVFIQ